MSRFVLYDMGRNKINSTFVLFYVVLLDEVEGQFRTVSSIVFSTLMEKLGNYVGNPIYNELYRRIDPLADKDLQNEKNNDKIYTR